MALFSPEIYDFSQHTPMPDSILQLLDPSFFPQNQFSEGAEFSQPLGSGFCGRGSLPLSPFFSMRGLTSGGLS